MTPRRPRTSLVLALALLVPLALPAAARAADAASPEADRRAKVALRVGDVAVTVGEIEARLAEIPPIQRATFGSSSAEITKKFVETVLVRELLLGQGAQKRELASQLPTSQAVLRARSSATLRALRRQLPSPMSIPDEDVKRYYDENRSRFDSPERVQVWRILVKTEADAERILGVMKQEASIGKWNEIARAESLDKATSMRGGNLGFLSPDGTSNEAGVTVDAKIVASAKTVKDGELVGRPVKEGEAYAVVWRRGTVPATKRSLEDASAQIRATLFRERSEAAEKKLMDELRARKVRDVDESLLGLVDLGAFDAGLMAPRVVPTGRSPQAPAPQAPAPKTPR